MHVLKRVAPLALGLALAAGGVSAGQANVREDGKSFNTWLAEFRQSAEQEGITPDLLDRALGNLTPLERVIKADRNQPEFKSTLKTYMDKRINNARVIKARKLMAKHKDVLDRVYAKYKVHPRFLVSFWGIESAFGRYQGKMPVYRALATLAWEGRREEFFSKQLMLALRIVDEGHAPLEKMKGSWAGAMGQAQFMPSTFMNYAVDFDGDGIKDIWSNEADMFASAANYLSSVGWNDDLTWGRPVLLPDDFHTPDEENKVRRVLADWQMRGVRRIDGSDLPQVPGILARIVLPDEPENGLTPAYLVYDNYDVILHWNRSNRFAVTIGTLADRIGSGS